MIKGSKPVPETTSIANLPQEKELLLGGTNVAAIGESFLFTPRNLDGDITLVVYDAKGNVVFSTVAAGNIEVPTVGYNAGIYFYMVSDAAGFCKTGKLLIKE